MTTREELAQYRGGGGDRIPAFVFARVGDAVRGTILRSEIVEVKSDRGPQVKMVVELDVVKAKGGHVERDGDFIVSVDDVAPGTAVTVWVARHQLEVIDDAVAAAGADELADGGVLVWKLVERRDVGKAKPMNVFEATYEPPSVEDAEARGVARAKAAMQKARPVANEPDSDPF